MRSARIHITPEILTYAREKIGYSIPSISQEINVKPSLWEQWEEGKAKPTAIQLISIADKLERTPAFFYLEEPPVEEDIFTQFRTLENISLVGIDPKLIKIIMEAKRNRLNIIELYRQQNKDIQEVPEITSFPEGIGERGLVIRQWLGINEEIQFNFSAYSNALSSWRKLLEQKDIYLIQFPRIEVSEARGFAFAESKIPIIGINSQDSYTARIFTLIHELIHVFLRDSVLVNTNLTKYYSQGSVETEQYCNRLAAEILVPTISLKNTFNERNDTFQEIKRLARKYKVSPYMMAIRLYSSNLIMQSEFDGMKEELRTYTPSEKSLDGGNAYRNRIVQKGRLLLSNAFQSYFDGNITLAELSQLTQWKVQNLNKMAIEIFGGPKDMNYL